MLQVSLAAAAVVTVAIAPTGAGGTALVVALAGLDVALGAPLRPALDAAVPLLAFLAAALSLAEHARRAGLAERAAERLARAGRGSSARLFVLVCGLCAVTTCLVSLDGAVVLMVPLLMTLSSRHGAPLAPLLLGTVLVAGAASVALPQGNPANLLVIERLGLSPAEFTERMLLPGVAAAAACVLATALLERRALSRSYAVPVPARAPRWSARERHAAGALGLAGLVAAASPLAGIAPWWPFSAVAVLALASAPAPRARPVVPVRLVAQVAALIVLIAAPGLAAPQLPAPGTASLLLVAAGVGVAACVANNLPVSAGVAGLLGAGPFAYAATLGLGVGALATPQGSVSTLLARELAGAGGRELRARRLAAPAGGALLAATLALAL